MLRCFIPPLLLIVLTAAFFAPLTANPDRVLYSDYSDMLGEHVPTKRFIARSWRETGELPRWCPYRYAGSAFVHDIPAATFYPPHLLICLGPEEYVGPLMSWNIAGHVLLAGLLMYVYARRQALSAAGALVAALGFMFGGKWLLEVFGGGHYCLIGLAWLPLVVLLLEEAVQRRSLGCATGAGLTFGVLTLGTHPQYTFYAAVLLVLWTLGSAWAAKLLPRWLACGAWAGLIASGVAAIQLLPTWEASHESTRGIGVGSMGELGSGLRALRELIGPALTRDPPGQMWEDRGGLTVIWVWAALIAPLVCGTRERYRAGLALALVLFAAGGSVLVQGLPGFRMFRDATRMFVPIAFPVAFLAGAATDALFACELSAERKRLARRALAWVLMGTAILAGGSALRLALAEHRPMAFHVYWLTLLVTVPAGAFLLFTRHKWSLPRRQLAWTLVLLVDSWALTAPFIETRPYAVVAERSACVRYLVEQTNKNGERWRVLDRDAPGTAGGTPLGTGAPLAMIYGLEPVRGDISLDNRRYKEFLQFIAGTNEPLRPFSGPLVFPVIGNVEIVNKKLLDLLLGSGYLVQPSAEPIDLQQWEAVFEDATPAAYDFVDGGRIALPPYTVYRNRTGLPRAFVVSHAKPLPIGQPAALQALLSADLRHEVFLEGEMPPASDGAGSERVTRVGSYDPNRVTVEVDDGAVGWLVLADVWYSGWTCTVNGQPTPVRRGDYLFRAVAVPRGSCIVEFRFEPESARWGRWITLGTLLCAGLILFATVVRALLPERQRVPECL